jgi:hypothetical protein
MPEPKPVPPDCPECGAPKGVRCSPECTSNTTQIGGGQ